MRKGKGQKALAVLMAVAMCLSIVAIGITDVSVIRDLANALKIDVSDVKNFMTEEKAERSEEQEKYLDKHNPLRIMQDAVNNHDQEILDTIASKREEKI